ncbi:MAG: hypothetical protein KY440_14215 [Actinobacteria bacterium]|nr:hypothetical protein [Actinomycetota bacterium]
MTGASSRPAVLRRAALRGAIAGVAGVAAMTVGEKIEQAVTHRPNSYVPGRSLGTLLTGQQPDDTDRPLLLNHAMHWGTGAALGALRGVWAAVGLRGPRAHAAHTVVRLSFDQTMENATGVGAPPRTWPVAEQLLDSGHKALYSLVTGILAERLVAPELESRRGTTSH